MSDAVQSNDSQVAVVESRQAPDGTVVGHISAVDGRTRLSIGSNGSVEAVSDGQTFDLGRVDPHELHGALRDLLAQDSVDTAPPPLRARWWHYPLVAAAALLVGWLGAARLAEDQVHQLRRQLVQLSNRVESLETDTGDAVTTLMARVAQLEEGGRSRAREGDDLGEAFGALREEVWGQWAHLSEEFGALREESEREIRKARAAVRQSERQLQATEKQLGAQIASLRDDVEEHRAAESGRLTELNRKVGALLRDNVKACDSSPGLSERYEVCAIASPVVERDREAPDFMEALERIAADRMRRDRFVIFAPGELSAVSALLAELDLALLDGSCLGAAAALAKLERRNLPESELSTRRALVRKCAAESKKPAQP